jgi:hypothetical protein
MLVRQIHSTLECIDKENCWDSSVILFTRTACNKRNFGLITPLPLTFFSPVDDTSDVDYSKQYPRHHYPRACSDRCTSWKEFKRQRIRLRMSAKAD